MQKMETLELGEGRRQRELGLGRLSENWGWYLAAGVAIGVTGLLALGRSAFTTLASVSFLGWLLAVSGIIALLHSFTFLREGFGTFLAHLLAGALYLVAGLLMVANPGLTAMTITLMLAPLFLVGGLVRVASAFFVRPPEWGWSLLSGAFTSILGLAILAQWPVSGLWLIGTFVGIEMMCYGWSIALFALALKQAPKLRTPDHQGGVHAAAS